MGECGSSKDDGVEGLNGAFASASNLAGIRGGSSGDPSGFWLKGCGNYRNGN